MTSRPEDSRDDCDACGGSGHIEIDYEDGGNYYSGPCSKCASDEDSDE